MRTRLLVLALLVLQAGCAGHARSSRIFPWFRDYTCRRDNLTLRLTHAMGLDTNRLVVYVVWQLPHGGSSDMTDVQALAFLKHWDPAPGRPGLAYVSPDHPDRGMEVHVESGFDDVPDFSVWYSPSTGESPFQELHCTRTAETTGIER